MYPGNDYLESKKHFFNIDLNKKFLEMKKTFPDLKKFS